MEYVAMKCPNCAGDINYQIGMTTCKCPYCDSTVKITLSDREAIYEQQVIEREAEQKARIEYLEKLRKWKILLRIFMAVDVVCGIPLVFIEKDSPLFTVTALLMCFFMFAAAPIVHKLAPVPPLNVSAPFNKKELPTGTGKLYGIFIGLYLAGGLVGSMAFNATNGNSSDSDSAASSVVSQAEDTEETDG